MAGSTASVGLLYDGVPTGAQQAAHEWLQSRQLGRTVAFDELTGAERPHSLHEQFDVLWWHRETVPESGKLERVRTRLESFLQSGAALLLTGGTLTAIDELAVESVSPDVVGYEHGEEVGLLWRRLYDDHPVPNEMDALRMPLFGGGDVLLTRYEGILPERGEILASTVWDGQDHPNEMTVCSWRHGKGTVLGFGGPLVFGEHRFSDNRDRVLSALFGSLERYDHPSRPKTAAELTEMRKRLTPDRSRPGYHITPPGNWLNDPNGLFRWNDRYHVFYQYNPGGPFHNTMHWGHATSEDLCTWQDEPVALTPSPDGPDRDGCWSGCAVDDDGL